MGFKKGNKFGNRFTSENQPAKKGRKKANDEITALLEKYGIDIRDLPIEQVCALMAAPMFMTAAKTAEMSKDEEAMMLARAVSKAMFGKNSWQVIRDILDRMYGKPKQQQDVTTNGRDIGPSPSFGNTVLLFPKEDE